MEERDYEDSEEFTDITEDFPHEDDMEAMEGLEGLEDAQDEAQGKHPMPVSNHRPPVDVDAPIGFFQRILKMLLGR